MVETNKSFIIFEISGEYLDIDIDIDIDIDVDVDIEINLKVIKVN